MKSLITTQSHHPTLSITRVISMAVSLTLVLLVYSSFSISGVFAVPPDPGWSSSSNCTFDDGAGPLTCCWRERVPGQILGERYCQTCTPDGKGNEVCDQKELQFFETSTTPTPTPPPTTPFGPTEGIFDPPKASSPFGPTEGIFDPPKASPPPVTTPAPPQTLPPTPPQDDGSGPLNPQGGGILQQPEEVEDPEDEGENEEEEDPSEGAETAGPLT